MTQPTQSDPTLALLTRKWNILISGVQELSEYLPIIVQELESLRAENTKLRQDNTDLKKLFEDKKQEVKKP